MTQFRYPLDLLSIVLEAWGFCRILLLRVDPTFCELFNEAPFLLWLKNFEFRKNCHFFCSKLWNYSELVFQTFAMRKEKNKTTYLIAEQSRTVFGKKMSRNIHKNRTIFLLFNRKKCTKIHRIEKWGKFSKDWLLLLDWSKLTNFETGNSLLFF